MFVKSKIKQKENRNAYILNQWKQGGGVIYNLQSPPPNVYKQIIYKIQLQLQLYTYILNFIQMHNTPSSGVLPAVYIE